MTYQHVDSYSIFPHDRNTEINYIRWKVLILKDKKKNVRFSLEIPLATFILIPSTLNKNKKKQRPCKIIRHRVLSHIHIFLLIYESKVAILLCLSLMFTKPGGDQIYESLSLPTLGFYIFFLIVPEHFFLSQRNDNNFNLTAKGYVMTSSR